MNFKQKKKKLKPRTKLNHNSCKAVRMTKLYFGFSFSLFVANLKNVSFHSRL